MSELIDRERCKRELNDVWDRYGIWTIIHALADIVEDDVNLLRDAGMFPEEIVHKDCMVELLRRAASAPPSRPNPKELPR